MRSTSIYDRARNDNSLVFCVGFCEVLLFLSRFLLFVSCLLLYSFLLVFLAKYISMIFQIVCLKAELNKKFGVSENSLKGCKRL